MSTAQSYRISFSFGRSSSTSGCTPESLLVFNPQFGETPRPWRNVKGRSWGLRHRRTRSRRARRRGRRRRGGDATAALDHARGDGTVWTRHAFRGAVRGGGADVARARAAVGLDHRGRRRAARPRGADEAAGDVLRILRRGLAAG